MATSQTQIEPEASSHSVHEDEVPTKTETVVEVKPESRPSRKDTSLSTSSMVLIVMAGVFALTTLLFAMLYTRELLHNLEASSSAASMAAAICNTADCVSAATMLIKNMNVSADPCMDFNEFACGRFIREATVPIIRTGNIMAKDTNLKLAAIVAEPIQPGEPVYLSNMKRYFMACTDEAKIEAMGVSGYLSEKTFIDAWPTLNPNWMESSFNLNDLLERQEKAFATHIFRIQVGVDMMDSTKKVLEITEPQMVLPQEYYRQPRNAPILMAYQTALAKIAVVVGAVKNVAEQDAKDFVDLEVELAKIMVPREERRVGSAQYNPVKLMDLSRMYPLIDIPRTIRAAFSTARVSLADDQTVINVFPTFMGNLSSVIFNTSKRIVQNHFGFRYAISRVDSLTQSLRDIQAEFDKVLSGDSSTASRWQECLEGVSKTFWKGLSKQYVTRTFSEDSKAYALDMIKNILKEFKQMLTDNPWIGPTTKEEALKKLAVFRLKIGYPDVDFEDADIEKQYKDYVMREDNFYADRNLANQLPRIEGFSNFRQPFNKDEWYMAPFDVNAQYIPNTNEINFPAAVLQPPVFSVKFQDSMNYGGIGTVVGHEITHGFDDRGSQFDSEGNLRNWWAADDRNTFLEKTQCIVNQYNNFNVPEIGRNVSGINTQGEAVADTDGLKVSFRAFKKLSGTGGKSLKLPGINLTPDQLFFVSYSQFWCSKVTPQYLMYLVSSDNHPPPKFRIVGALQNSQDFAKAYNCPQGSMMNPQKKCSVW